jgi:hypothetical protein
VNDETLERRAAGMRKSVTPPPGAWERIEARREAAERGNRAAARPARRPVRLGAPAWAGLAAAAVVAAAAAVVVPRLLAPRDAGAAEAAALRRELRDAERQYAAARDRLLASLRAVAGAAGPAAVADLEDELLAMDRLMVDFRAQALAAPASDEWQTTYRLVKLYRSRTAGVARADDLVRSVSYREDSQ